MKALVAAAARDDVNSVAMSVVRAGLEPVRIHSFDPKYITAEVAAILVVGLLKPRPWLALIDENLPLGLFLRTADLMPGKGDIDRLALRVWSQRADRFYVETDPCANRLVGILGLLGRLNRFTMGTPLVQVWCGEDGEDHLSQWLEHPQRSPDADKDWPRLGGDGLWELKTMRSWYDPRRWFSN